MSFSVTVGLLSPLRVGQAASNRFNLVFAENSISFGWITTIGGQIELDGLGAYLLAFSVAVASVGLLVVLHWVEISESSPLLECDSRDLWGVRVGVLCFTTTLMGDALMIVSCTRCFFSSAILAVSKWSDLNASWSLNSLKYFDVSFPAGTTSLTVPSFESGLPRCIREAIAASLYFAAVRRKFFNSSNSYDFLMGVRLERLASSGGNRPLAVVAGGQSIAEWARAASCFFIPGVMTHLKSWLGSAKTSISFFIWVSTSLLGEFVEALSVTIPGEPGSRILFYYLFTFNMSIPRR